MRESSLNLDQTDFLPGVIYYDRDCICSILHDAFPLSSHGAAVYIYRVTPGRVASAIYAYSNSHLELD